MYSCSLDRSAKAWDACSGRLLLSVACPAFLRAVTTDPAEVFLFAAGGGGVIYQVRACLIVVGAAVVVVVVGGAVVVVVVVFVCVRKRERDNRCSWAGVGVFLWFHGDVRMPHVAHYLPARRCLMLKLPANGESRVRRLTGEVALGCGSFVLWCLRLVLP